jgi:hypothetical protein
MTPHMLRDGRWTIAVPCRDGRTEYSCYVFATEWDASCFISSGGASIILSQHSNAI